MGGQTGGDQTVRNISDVDPVTQAWRSGIMNAGGQLYNQGAPAYYPGNTVVPFSNQTQGGLDYLQNYAGQGAPNIGAANNAAQRGLSGYNPAMPYAMDAASGGLSGNAGIQALQGFGGQSNPYLDGLWQRGSEQVANAVNGNFMQAGRFGANAAQTGALTRGLGDLYSQIYAPAYEAERNRGLSAAQTTAGLFDSGANRTLQGIDLAGGLWSQGNQDAARTTALLNNLYSYGLQPGQAMMDVGGIYEGMAGDYLNADRERYDYNANAPWGMLERYAGLMNGLPTTTNSSQTSPSTRNRTMSALGGAAAGAQLGSQIYPGYGTAIGAIVGGLWGGYG